MRTASKFAGFICGIALAAVPVSRVSADSLQLTGANPAGTVNLYGSALIPDLGNATTQVDAYAGVLNWTDTSTNPNTAVYTYCIDVASIIYVGNPYTFSYPPVALTPSVNLGYPTNGGDLTTQQVNAIYTLWTDPYFHDAGNLTSAATVAAIGQTYAGEFQVALWDILYNVDSTNNTLDGTALNFAPNNPLGGSSLTSGELSGALGEAYTDYANASSSTLGANPGIDALITTNGQNQAIYIGGSGPFVTAVPLPASFGAGLALLGLAGVYGAWQLRVNRVKAVV